MLVWQNEKWTEVDQNTTIDTLISKGYRILNQVFCEHVSDDEAITERYQELTSWMLNQSKTSLQYYNLRREILFMVKDNTKKRDTLYCLGEPQNAPVLNIQDSSAT